MPPKRATAATSGIDEAKIEAPANRQRRPSANSLESIATMADLADYDSPGGSHNNGSSPRAAPSSLSSSSSTAAGSMPSPQFMSEMQSLLTRFGATFGQSNSGGSNITSSTPAPSTTPSGGGTAIGTATTGGTISGTAARIASNMSLGGVSTPHVRDPVRVPPIQSVDDDNGDNNDVHVPAVSTNDLQWHGIYVHDSNRWAPSSIREVNSVYQSFRNRALAIRCRDPRNKHEVDTLSVICDAALEGRMDVVLEIAIRRMVGVEEADANGGRCWDMATALDLAKPGTLGSDTLRRQARRDAAQVRAIRSSSSTNGNRTTSGRGGKWRGRGSNNNNNNRSGGGDARQGSGKSGSTATK